MKRIRGWYFSKEGCTLQNGDDREIHPGITHEVKFPCMSDGREYSRPTLCACGLHASKSIFDALAYSPGPFVWRVELSGDIVIGNDKMVASERKYLWGYNAKEVLQAYSRKNALDVVHLWDAPQVVVDYLKTGDESLKAAARDEARDVMWDTDTEDAAWATAWDVMWDTDTEDAAWATAWAAAEAAMWAAATWGCAPRAVAWAAYTKKYKKRLTSMIVANKKLN